MTQSSTVAKGGRPRTGRTVKLTIWLMVELLRDRRDPKKERVSAREASKRLEQHLAESFRGGHELGWERIRDHHKEFERVARQSNTGDERREADLILAQARLLRELRGWDTSTWSLVIDPADMVGYDWSVDGEQIIGTRRSS